MATAIYLCGDEFPQEPCGHEDFVIHDDYQLGSRVLACTVCGDSWIPGYPPTKVVDTDAFAFWLKATQVSDAFRKLGVALLS